MPVLTHSQTRASNAPKVPVQYPCYYKNFLITNEDMKKQVDAFYLGQIDKLDYPLVYKGFTITNSLAMKKRVDDFYDGLGKNYPTRDNKIIQYLRKYEHYEFPLLDPPSNLENMITYL